MSETAPAAPAEPVLSSMEKPPAKKRGKKPVGLTGGSRKVPGSSVSKLITEALSVSQERAGMSLAALKKALAAAGYDVEKNNRRIKLGLKSLVSKGTLVQTRGTGASGSFKLSKKATPEPAKGRVKKGASANAKKLVLPKGSKSPKSAKTNKRTSKARTPAAQPSARGGRKSKGAKGKQQLKSPGKGRTGKPKTGKPKLTQQRTNPRKTASKK
ncbi:histone H1t [Equus przewalskii]|uniref:H1.6 linker histone, cluster member n=3 Tax=Equus TaxID=9789 RepID=A0A3Q2GVX5_HORSE|nr:histone H1t [Equus caballus]XP_008539389.1 PREDICTED: histone H1t [Equus przewalskii]